MLSSGDATETIRETVDAVYRTESRRVLATLIRLLGDFDLAEEALHDAFTAAKWLCDRGTLTLEQETLAEFITSGAYERHLHKARRENTRRRAALLEAINEHLRGRVTITGDRSGTHLVLWPRGRTSEETLIARAAAAGVGVYGISRYAIRRRAPGLMLGYSRMSEEEIREGIRRLAAVLP